MGAIAYYYWQQATSLPDWYQTDRAKPAQENNIDPSQTSPSSTEGSTVIATDSLTAIKTKIQENIRQQVQDGTASPAPIGAHRQQSVEVNLSDRDLTQLLQTEITQKFKLPSSDGTLIQTQINQGSLEMGAVVNPQKLDSLDLSRSQKAIVDRVMTTFPQLKDQDFYLGINGKIQLQNGQLILPDNSRVKVGNLSFTIQEIAQKLNVPVEKLQQSLQMNVDSLNLRDFQLKENQVILKVNPADYDVQ
jgi:hypothetical protein